MPLEIITENKFVELSYKITDKSNGKVIARVDTPLGYVQGNDSPLFEQVTLALEGKTVGDVIETPIDCSKIFGKKLTDLTFTDKLDNVPKKYRKVGATITTENKKGEPKDFVVTKIENGKLTVDGNHPLAGKNILFTLKVLSVRDATKEDIESSGNTDISMINKS